MEIKAKYFILLSLNITFSFLVCKLLTKQRSR